MFDRNTEIGGDLKKGGIYVENNGVVNGLEIKYEGQFKTYFLEMKPSVDELLSTINPPQSSLTRKTYKRLINCFKTFI